MTQKSLTFILTLLISSSAFSQDEGHGGIVGWANTNNLKKYYNFDPNMRLGSSIGLFTGYGPVDISAIYTDGLVWGGLVYDGEFPVKRVGGKTYISGEQPGWIENGLPFDWESQSGHECRIYRYRKDWEHLPDSILAEEAADIFNLSIDIDEVTQAEKQAVYNQYRLDFEEWPAQRGAPFVDQDKNGTYDPEDGDYPGFLGADQVLWMISNDLSHRTFDFSGSDPIGLEHRITAWAYEKRKGFSGTVLERHQLTSHAGGPIEDMYIGYFSDPDVGNYGDDFVGCDSLLNLAFAYNAHRIDTVFRDLGLQPGAVGYQLLQGPIIYDSSMALVRGRDSEMSSFIYFSSGGGVYTFPPDPDYTKVLYNQLRGYLGTDSDQPEGMYITPDSIPTFFPLAGDPLSGDSNVDGILEEAGDRRMMLNAGPFSLEPGQTVEVAYAITAEISTNHLTSISKMKYNSRLIKEGWSEAPEEKIAETPPENMPKKFFLLPNYPNPFNGYTRIQFYIEEKSRAVLEVFNIAGQRVDVIFDGQAQGLQEITWQPENQPSGTYIIRLQAHGRKSYIKAVYIK